MASFLKLDEIPESSVIAELIIQQHNGENILSEEKKEVIRIRNGLANAYIAYMEKKIIEAIRELKKYPSVSKKLNIDSFNEDICFEETKIHFHTIHYGGPYYNGKWNLRNIYEDYKNLFRILQAEMFSKGYFLLDLSDNSKSFNPVIVLFVSKPLSYDNHSTLWHYYNKLNIN